MADKIPITDEELFELVYGKPYSQNLPEPIGKYVLKYLSVAEKCIEKGIREERERIGDYLRNKYGDVGVGASRRAVYHIAKDLCLDLVLRPVLKEGKDEERSSAKRTH